MAGHSGMLVDGDPIVCSGYNGTGYDVKCFKFEISTGNWKRVNLQKNFDNLSNNYSNMANWKCLVLIHKNQLFGR